MDTRAKREAAIEDLATFDGVVVAFSGGVDSSVVAALAHEALGDDAVACTARSETLPAAELGDATRVAEEIGIRIDVVCDGTNASDPGEGHRPGLRAVEELDAYSPLLEHGITKEEVREIARHYGLSVADKPSMACLSSRIPTGLEVTEERLTRVEVAETLLRTWGFEQFRVRDHDGLARIEVGEDELERALDPEFAAAAREHLTDAGFDHVTLDLEGYRTGSVSPADDEPAADVLDADYPSGG
ncbi:alpha hydrolase [Halobacteriales archaeon QS_9_70_65]|nr:MAG: alpha hydrolase [Halobacteriales archaeon QS_9_70_65]